MADDISAVHVENKTVVVRWPDDVSDLPITLSNVFAVQPTADGVVITLGQAAPPLLSGTPEEQRKTVQEITEVPATPLYRVVVSIAVAQQLTGALAALLAQQGQAPVQPASVVRTTGTSGTKK